MEHVAVMDKRTGWLPLAGWILLCNAVGMTAGLTSDGGNSAWYQSLEKSPLNPPSWVFMPVWTALYTIMGIAGWRVWRSGGFEAHRAALTMFFVQLTLNFAWSYIFFDAQRPDLALAEILVLWAVIVTTMVLFNRVDRTAARLLAPYLAWVSFATFLNASIVFLN